MGSLKPVATLGKRVRLLKVPVGPLRAPRETDLPVRYGTTAKSIRSRPPNPGPTWPVGAAPVSSNRGLAGSLLRRANHPEPPEEFWRTLPLDGASACYPHR